MCQIFGIEIDMKVVVDIDIPFVEGVFEPYATVLYKKGDQISREDVIDADVLIVRTRTRCDEHLLGGTSVKMVSTATIGMDHIDLDYCASHGIHVENAAGCNAGGVMQYVFSAVYGIAARKGIKIDECTFGIIGVGHVGSKIEAMARYLGLNVLLCDPPRAAAEGPEKFCSMEYLLENSNVVTMHVPLDETTRGMADETFFALMRPGAIFINAARGEVIDEQALIAAANSGNIVDIVNHIGNCRFISISLQFFYNTFRCFNSCLDVFNWIISIHMFEFIIQNFKFCSNFL